MDKTAKGKITLLILQCVTLLLLLVPGVYSGVYTDVTVTVGQAGENYISQEESIGYYLSFLDKMADVETGWGVCIIALMVVCLAVLIVNAVVRSKITPIVSVVISTLQLLLFSIYNGSFCAEEHTSKQSYMSYYIGIVSFAIIMIIANQIILEILDIKWSWGSTNEEQSELHSTFEQPAGEMKNETSTGSEVMAALSRVAILKRWLDENIITQEEFEAKKQGLLGLDTSPMYCRPLVMPIQNIEAMLKQCKELADCAAITPDEFALKKAQLLNMI